MRGRLGKETGIAAVVKANAYGHGLIRVADAALEFGCSHLAVAVADEGAALRRAGLKAPVIILGLISPQEALLCAENDLLVTVSAEEHLPPLKEAARAVGRSVGVLLKADTGMNRVGAVGPDAVDLAVKLSETAELVFYGMFTHFASAGGPDLRYAATQLSSFERLLAELSERGVRPPVISAAASGAVFNLPGSHFSLVRAGITMYGLSASEFLRERLKLQPALRLITRVAQLKKIAAGSAVGYEMTWRAERDTFIATLPVGYGDGYNRRLSNKASVLIAGRRRPVVGNVCMDQLMVSLENDGGVRVGDEAVLVGSQGGEEITLEELARLAGTINYELACAITERVPRIYVEEG
jgi:alanine racemase